MIPGTKARPTPTDSAPTTGPDAAADFSGASATATDPPRSDLEQATSQPAAAEQKTEQSFDRRSWFRSLGPALGRGLVDALRTGNLLQEELRESSRRR